ncbi:MAG: group I truncated hemoglobin [Gemmatimonadota bacterium]
MTRSTKPWIALALMIAMGGGLQSAVAQEADPPAEAREAEQAEQQEERTLYQRLGGLAPISVVVSDFIDVLVPDPMLNENPAIDAARQRVPPAYLKYHVTAMVCQVTGGPCEYHGRGMEEAHAHLNITEDEWDRMVTLFKQVLAEHEVPERESEELLEIIGTTKADIVTG